MTDRDFGLVSGSALDRPWHRLPWLVPLALLLWTLMLAAFAHLLGERLETPPPAPIEVGLLMGGGSAGGGSTGAGAGAPAVSAIATPAAPAAKTETPKVEKPRAERPASAAPTPAPVATPVAKATPAPVATPAVKETPAKALAKAKPEEPIKPARGAVARAKKIKPPPTPAHRVAKAAPPPLPRAPSKASAPPPADLAAKTGAASTSPAGAPAPTGGGAGAGAGGAIGSASGGAQAIYAPMPTIPDDLRADIFHAEAVARFEVLADGTAQVVLVRPTPNPRLNYLLLEALKQWRFFPAVKGGKAVASVVEIRIPIAIE